MHIFLISAIVAHLCDQPVLPEPVAPPAEVVLIDLGTYEWTETVDPTPIGPLPEWTADALPVGKPMMFDQSSFAPAPKHPKLQAAKAKVKAGAHKLRSSANFVKPIADVVLDVVLASVTWLKR